MDRKIKGYWSFDKVREEALRFTKRSDFNKLSKSAYLAAYRNGWLDDVCSHMQRNNWLNDICSHMIDGRKPNGYWTIDKVKEEALKYNSIKSFEKGSTSYQIAYRNGWLDDVCSHMRDKRKSKDEFEKLINDMKATINII